MSARVVEIRAADLDWSFRDGRPRAHVGMATEVDPFPAYPHETALVEESLAAVERAFTVAHPPTIYVLQHEPLSRTNGWAQPDTSYDGDEWSRAPGHIVLAGKRIPPHPAVTRYVVAHEYGHHVQTQVEDARGAPLHGNGDLLAEYAELRHLPDGHERYGGGCWHSNAGELFANDFRILIAGVESDYWPHPGYARPEDVDGLAAWWAEALA